MQSMVQLSICSSLRLLNKLRNRISTGKRIIKGENKEEEWRINKGMVICKYNNN